MAFVVDTEGQSDLLTDGLSNIPSDDESDDGW